MYNPNDYNPGDQVIIFEGSRGFTTGKVVRRSPSGQLTVATERTGVRRFTARGREVGQDFGGWASSCPYLEAPAEARTRADAIRAENRRNRLRNEFATACGSLHRMDPTGDKAAVLEAIDKLRAFVEGI